MPLGPGKYDLQCSIARLSTQAKGAIVIILDGNQGSGFSCQADVLTTARIPDMLEHIAKEIRSNLAKGRL